MAAPASPIAPAQEEIVHRRAVRRNTVYTDPLAQSIFQPNYLELNFISHHFKFFFSGSPAIIELKRYCHIVRSSLFGAAVGNEKFLYSNIILESLILF